MAIRRFTILILTVITICHNCKNEDKIPLQYVVGYAILKTKDLPYDGGDYYTFYLLPKQKKGSKVTVDSDKSITFIFTQGNEFIEYKRNINEKGWINDGDLILVKVDYEMLTSDWMEYIATNSTSININGKEYKIRDYVFSNLVDNKGNDLYRINSSSKDLKELQGTYKNPGKATGNQLGALIRYYGKGLLNKDNR